MDEGTTALAAAIGGRVRTERTRRGWTLDRLSGLAGVSRRMLVNVEHGVVNPSVGTLLRLSDALGVGLPSLVGRAVGPAEPAAPTITRRGRAPVLWSSERGGRGLLVAGTPPPDVVELWEWTLAPGDRHESDAHAAGTQELLSLQEGALTVVVGEESVALEAGDALAFAGDVPHSYTQVGEVPARFTLCVFEPGVGASGGAEDGRG